MQRHNISLIGPPGVGKSSVGKLVAAQIGWRFVDTDAEIVTRLGMPLHRIIATHGEAYFRDCEKKLCQDIADIQHCVIATGGGLPLCTDNRDVLRNISHVYYLQASAKPLAERLAKRDHHSSLGLQRVHNLLQQRLPTYTSSSFLPINTHNKSVAQVAADIVQRHCTSSAFITPNTLGLTIASAGCAPYPVYLQQDLLQHVGNWLRFILGDVWRVAVLADKTVWQHYGNRIAKSLRRVKQPFDVWLLPGGERSKTMRTVTRLYCSLLEKGLTRDSCVLAVGGGCMSDVAGFVAATFARGIPWMVIPTSLLAMVDACVGGKTAVNLPQAKNAVGSFYPPKAILLDPNTLQTLPCQHMRCGVAEIIKHGLLGDLTLLQMLQQPNCSLYNEQLIQRAIAVKAALVQEDPLEQGQRALLNLGHTFAHALERVTNYKMLHGYAVALGLLAAAHLSYDLGLCDKTVPMYVKQLLEQWQLPTKLPATCCTQAVLQAMQTDKKQQQGKLRFILLKQVGVACVTTQILQKNVLQALDRLT